MMAPFIGISGRSGSGKDAAAARIVDRGGYRRVAIADPLKDLCGVAFQLSRDQLWGDGRNTVDGRWGLTPR